MKLKYSFNAGHPFVIKKGTVLVCLDVSTLPFKFLWDSKEEPEDHESLTKIQLKMMSFNAH